MVSSNADDLLARRPKLDVADHLRTSHTFRVQLPQVHLMRQGARAVIQNLVSLPRQDPVRSPSGQPQGRRPKGQG